MSEVGSDASDALESRLRTEALRNPRRLDRELPSYRCELVGGGEAIIKLAADHTDLMVCREVAAWYVAKCLSWREAVPVTVLRELDSFADTTVRTQASIQVFVPGAIDRPDLELFSDDDRWQAAVFDAIVKPTDRGIKEGGGNWLGVGDESGNLRLKLIDHEHSFASGLRLSVFYKLKHSQPIPQPILKSLQELETRLSANDMVSRLIGRAPAEKLLARIRELLKRRSLDLSPLA